MLEKITCCMQAEYGITATAVRPTKGGWSALAYIVEAGKRAWFLKVYEKRLSATEKWIRRIPVYVPVVQWLDAHTALRGRVPHVVPALDGCIACEDAGHVFLLFDLIDGAPLDDTPMTPAQWSELAMIVGTLHQEHAALPLPAGMLTETFQIPFAETLREILSDMAMPQDLADMLRPYRSYWLDTLDTLLSLAETMQRTPPPFVLCHTDIHRWNLMQGKHLYLIDWEGLMLAPAEADLFSIAHHRCWGRFSDEYQRLRPGFALNEECLSFYVLRRVAEDFWEDLQRLLHDPLTGKERESGLVALRQAATRDALDAVRFLLL